MRCSAIAALLGSLLEVARPQDLQNTTDKTGTDSNPPGLSFVLRVKNSRKQLFHLGEIIEIEEDYSSSIPGQYFVIPSPRKVEGGSSSSLTILPNATVIDRVHQTGIVSVGAILSARCEAKESGLAKAVAAETATDSTNWGQSPSVFYTF